MWKIKFYSYSRISSNDPFPLSTSFSHGQKCVDGCACVFEQLSRGYDADLITIDEGAYQKQDFFLKSVAPVLMKETSSGAIISTPQGANNYMSRLAKKAGDGVINLVHLGRPCEACAKAKQICTHQALPAWKSRSRQMAYSKMLYEGREEDNLREQYAEITDYGLKCFSTNSIEFLMKSDEYVTTRTPEFIYIFVDPSGGGKSDFGITACFWEGSYLVVSGIYSHVCMRIYTVIIFLLLLSATAFPLSQFRQFFFHRFVCFTRVHEFFHGNVFLQRNLHRGFVVVPQESGALAHPPAHHDGAHKVVHQGHGIFDVEGSGAHTLVLCGQVQKKGFVEVFLLLCPHTLSKELLDRFHVFKHGQHGKYESLTAHARSSFGL